MPVHVSRKRGGVWYARGSVRVGKTTAIVAEYSTGCSARAAADHEAAARDAEIRQDILDGPAGRSRRLTIADCIVSYLSRPGGLQPYDQDRLADFNERIGDRQLSDAADAWTDWLASRRPMAPSSAARWRAILRAAIGHGAAANGTTAPAIPGVAGGGGKTRLAYLSRAEADRLVTGYNRWALPVAVVLRYQGLRTQEALRLDWRAVSWRRRTLFVTGTAVIGEARTKSRKARTVPMHRRVRVTLYLLWRSRGRPASGPMFLSSRGTPYADTRGHGGNPLKRAHATACRTAGIEGFRVHDWRHHWASHLVMAGVDLPTLMRLGGWSDHRMVLRYAAVGVEHMAEAIGRVA
jgi:integrase